jgi:hypothetical protein
MLAPLRGMAIGLSETPRGKAAPPLVKRIYGRRRSSTLWLALTFATAASLYFSVQIASWLAQKPNVALVETHIHRG